MSERSKDWFVIDPETTKIKAKYVHQGKAVNVAAAMTQKQGVEHIAVHRDAYLVGFKKTVTVTNLMTGKSCRIDAAAVGGPCDPSTERYWSM